VPGMAGQVSSVLSHVPMRMHCNVGNGLALRTLPYGMGRGAENLEPAIIYSQAAASASELTKSMFKDHWILGCTEFH
jgi:hypothetical protein